MRVDDHRAVTDPAGAAGGPVVLPAGQPVGDPRVTQHLAQRLGAGREGLGGTDVGTEDLVALGGLGGDLLLPLGGRVGDLLAEDLVRVDRPAPGAGGEPGLQVLDGDAVFDAARLGRGAREATGAQEDPGVVRARRLQGPVHQAVPRLVFGKRPLPVGAGERRVGVAAVERGAEVLDRLEGGLVGERGRVLVEVLLGLPEPVRDPLAQAGLLEEAGARPGGARRPVEAGLGEPGRGAQAVERLLPRLGVRVECRPFLGGGGPVRLERLPQRGVLPALTVGRGVQLVRGLVERVLRGGEHGRAAHAQHVGHQALVLPELVGGLGVEAVVTVGHQAGVELSVAREIRMFGDGGEHREREYRRDQSREASRLAFHGRERPWSGTQKSIRSSWGGRAARPVRRRGGAMRRTGTRTATSPRQEPRASARTVRRPQAGSGACELGRACLGSRNRGMTMNPPRSDGVPPVAG